MPMSEDFAGRLGPLAQDLAEHFGTPFHIYDEKGIRETARALCRAFSGISGFREYFAVKALPNPAVLAVMREEGFGFDCSSIPELMLSRRVGARGEDIMFTSNNTTAEEFAAAAAEGGSILNLDDVSLIPKVPRMPELICFRYNPGSERTGNSIIGNPMEAKYGVTREQIFDAYRHARELGTRRFGLHTMLASNECNHRYMVETCRMLLRLTGTLADELGIHFEFVNMGGGLGIPYRPDQRPLDLPAMGREIGEAFTAFAGERGWSPRLYMESGRFMTGPHGTLVTRAINRKEIYRTYVGVDACMSSLMRPGMYGAYHHITVAAKEGAGPEETVDVVGGLCENNDKFAIQRRLPRVEDGDIVFIHDTGAHGHAMGFTYNGKLRPKELLLRQDGSVALIRRAETPADYFATLSFEPDVYVGS